MLTAIKIAVRKIKRIPRDQLAQRIKLGLKKYISDYPYSISIQTVSTEARSSSSVGFGT